MRSESRTSLQLVEPAPESQHRAVGSGHGHHAVARARDRDGRDVRRARTRRAARHRGAVRGERRAEAGLRVAVGGDELRDRGGLEEVDARAQTSSKPGRAGTGPTAVARAQRSGAGDVARLAEQRLVEARPQPVLGVEVRGRRPDDRDQRGDRGHAQRDAPLEAHVRTTYPTPAHRVHEARLTLGLGLAAQVADVHVERARTGLEVEAPDVLVDLLARQDDAGVLHQQRQQVELGLGEVDVAIRRGAPRAAAGRGGGRRRRARARRPRAGAGAGARGRRARSSSSENGLTT